MSSKRFRRILVGVTIGTLLHGQLSAQDICQCGDCNALYTRIHQVQSVMWEICTEATANPDLMNESFSDSEYQDDYLAKWQKAIDDGTAAVDPSHQVSTPGGATNGFCETTIFSKGNSCLDYAVKLHEGVHEATCYSMLNSNHACYYNPYNWLGGGYLKCLTFKQYYQDDFKAYGTELKFEIEQFQNLKSKQCCTSLNIDPSIPNCPALSFNMLIKKIVNYFFA